MKERKCYPIVKTSKTQVAFRILLGALMVFTAIAHLTFDRVEFQAQVPNWIPFDKNAVVISSGIFEFLLGAAMMYGRHFKVQVGLMLALFYVLIFPGNIAQYINGIDAFGLDTDLKRFVRLFLQPVLVLWALWSAGVIKYWIELARSKKEKNE